MPTDESGRSDPSLGSTQTLASDETASSTVRFELPKAGSSIGRYNVRSRLGAGGMGIVFAAHDPELDRDVAIKLLRLQAGDDSRAQERLRREAQALAQLNHPNVVTVHDVGVHEGMVFVAMELVGGQTLTRWMASPRPVPEVLRVFAAAGAGLAAAHLAGIVHRDFKPDNVLIGSGDAGSRRVCVLDFGLARLADEEPSGPMDARASPTRAATLTRTGATMGTPAYMAPEQFAHREVTARSDQFSFCVALYEALYGERPFAGEGLAELVLTVSSGTVRAARSDVAVPGWIRPVLLRGLAVDPDDRFATMSDLLAALRGPAPVRARRWLVAGAVAAAVVVAGVIGWQHHARAQQAEACVAAGDVIDEVWGAAEADAVERGLGTAGVGSETIAGIVARLRGHANAWRLHARVACLRGTVEPTWDTETFDKARWCLDERRVQLGSVVAVLSEVDEQIARIGNTVAPILRSPANCTDEASLAALHAPPDSELAVDLVEVHGELARAEMLAMLGKLDEALQIVGPARERAEGLPWPRMHALSLGVHAQLLADRGSLAEAEKVAIAAHAVASEGNSWDVAFAAATLLVALVAERRGTKEEARSWAAHGEAALARVGDPTGARRADYLVNVGNAQYALSDYQGAVASWEQALELHVRTHGPEHADVASVHNNLGNVYDDLGRYRAAWAQHERSLAIRRKLFDPDHPKIAGSLNNLGIVAISMGRYAQATELLTEAAAVRERVFGAEHPYTAAALHNLGVAFEGLGDLAEARARLERARTIREATLGPEHPAVAESLDALATVCLREGDAEKARTLSERALAINEKAYGGDHVALAPNLGTLGRLHRAAGRHEQARAAFERALALRERANGPRHTALVRLLVGLAEVAAAQGEREAATARVDRALTIASAEDAAPELLAHARFAKAKLLWADADAHAAAIALAEQARDGLDASLPERSEIETWLQSHRRRE